MKRNICNHKNKVIRLFPDFSSTGVWCECGMGVGDPKKELPHIPEGIFELVQLWNNYWDDVCFKDHPSYLDGVTNEMIEFHQSRINSMGKELSKIISAYQPCRFEEKSSALFMSGRKDEFGFFQ